MKKILGLFFLAATLFLTGGEGNVSAPKAEKIAVKPWNNSRDPVYLLEIDKFPKFETEILLKNGRKIRFASVKSMMNFFYHPEKYPGHGVSPEGKEIDRLIVHDYLDGKSVPADKAWYVFGSRVVGPHGDDLIPLSSRTRAELFVQRHGGTRIMDYKELRSKGFGFIKYLDM
jgi:nitrous oxide reductase accessory protein NosL